MSTGWQQEYAHPSFRGWIGVGVRECTPPVGCYNRNWGAAEGDVVTGVHRPLQIKALVFRDSPQGNPLVYVSVELCVLRDVEDKHFRRALAEAIGTQDMSRVILQCTHTHAAVPFSFSLRQKPGGELLAEWCAHLIQQTIAVVREALANCHEAVLEWHIGSCPLAVNRDYPVTGEEGGLYACGFNPNQAADQTLVVGRVTALEQQIPIAILAHYACHPTTLAWQNSLISPDFIGAAEELVQKHFACPLLFMQGAAGELSPRQQYTGDTDQADRNGRVLGGSILALLENMLPAANRYCFDRVVTSGANLGVWSLCEKPQISTVLQSRECWPELPLLERASVAELKQELVSATERPLIERLERLIQREQVLCERDVVSLPVCMWQIGNSVWIGQAQEMYSWFQVELRRRLPNQVVLPMNNANGPWLGYIYRPELAGRDLYQVNTSPFMPQTLPLVTDFCERELKRWIVS